MRHDGSAPRPEGPSSVTGVDNVRSMELPNVLWIGGPAGAGKTTVARLLARRHGLRWYSSDTKTWVHRDRALAAGVTLPDRGPGSAHYDRRPMMIDDLRSLPASPLIVADGPLTPGMVESRPDITSQAVWLMPSREVQHARLRIRHPEGVPPAYLQSWGSTVRKFEKSGIRGIRVDHLTVAETLREVERVFAVYLGKGPTARSPEERRALIRHGNQALVAQYLSPTARPLATVEPGERAATFDCECAAAACDALIELRVSDAAAAVASEPPAILAPGHGN